MLKTLLVLCGVLVVSATGVQAQSAHSFAGRGSSLASARPSAFARPSASHSFGRSGAFAHGNGSYRGHRGHYYYLGGVPYFYPFGYGFGYPYYYGGFYGGFGDGYGYGYGGFPYGNDAYNGRISDRDNESANGNDNGGQTPGGSLPEAVQKQLAKRGYYKGTVDGEFGPASRSALSRFQKKQGLNETGKIDEPTLQALGFTDRR